MFGNIKCKNCGAASFRQINKDTFECKYCGVQTRRKVFKPAIEENKNNDINKQALEDIADEKQDINKKKNDKKTFALTKLLLCIFFGYYGVHRFVEGKIGTGFLFLFTHGLFGIGYICDIIRLANELADVNKTGENQ